MTESQPATDAKSSAIAFYSQFQNDRRALQTDIDAADALEALEGINSRLSELEKSYSLATGFLPGYDQRQCSEQLKELTAAYNAKRVGLAPKSKFAFKPKKATEGKEVASKPAPAPAKALNRDGAPRTSGALPPPPGSLVFSSLSNQLITLSAETFANQKHADVYLSSLTNCVVDLRCDAGQISRLQAEKMEGCLVMTGQITGSALIYGSKGTVWVIESQQVRIHDAAQTDFYLNVGSKPIIESSQALRFAPFSYSEKEKNFWNEVEDFNWLRQAHSPNWALMPEDARIADAGLATMFERAKSGVEAVELLQGRIPL